MARPKKQTDAEYIPPKDEQGKRSTSECPWCVYRKPEIEDRLKELNKNPKLHGAEIAELEEEQEKFKDGSFVRNVGGKYQCDDCGKQWAPSDLGKPYSIELERGEAWVTETTVRRLTRS